MATQVTFPRLDEGASYYFATPYRSDQQIDEKPFSPPNHSDLPWPVICRLKQLRWPVESPLKGIFQEDRGRRKGIDFETELGETVHAAYHGTVIFAGWTIEEGFCVHINHGWGLFTHYARCAHLWVETGAEVRRGDIIAQSDKSALEFEVRLHDQAISPFWATDHLAI